MSSHLGLRGYYLGNCSLANLQLKADGIECDFGFIVNRVLNDIGSLTQLKTGYGFPKLNNRYDFWED